jgi:nucleotide-binding universal stress UspA family protein
MTLPGSVLVATDLSPAADEALRQGDTRARDVGARLSVCHVLPDLSEIRVLFPQYAGFNPEMLAELQGKARAAVHDRVATAIGRRIPDDDVLIGIGSPESGIRAAIARVDAGVVVLGPGPTAARVAHHASWAVLVARPEPVGGGVLGATDFSDPALPAVETAATESVRRGVRLQILHAVNFDVNALALSGEVMAAPVFTDTLAILEDNARRRLGESLERFQAAGDCLVALGPAAIGIVDAAAALPAALVVVGSHGRSGLKRWVLGSVAERVMQAAPCSVLVVPLDRDTQSTGPAST